MHTVSPHIHSIIHIFFKYYFEVSYCINKEYCIVAILREEEVVLCTMGGGLQSTVLQLQPALRTATGLPWYTYSTVLLLLLFVVVTSRY